MELLLDIWPYIVAFLTLFVDLTASGHAVIYKRDSRSAVFWAAVIWMVPVFGAIFYLMFGVNRIKRRAASLLGSLERARSNCADCVREPEDLEKDPPEEYRHLAQLARLISNVVKRPLLGGNRIDPLINGDEAYPVMLEAIARAERSVAFSTYIFDTGPIGQDFKNALAAAVKRGVEVRVIIDATGARYSWRSMVPQLARAGVPVVRFLPTFPRLRPKGINLRNHRKILVIDGKLGFTGGMNIRPGNLIKENPRHPVLDVHFQIEGPVVSHLMEAFADDWKFCAKESLTGEGWFPPLKSVGETIARGISDGPDEDFDKLDKTIQGALACAQHSVRIVTPYFLPEQSLISAINIAALRGVKIDIIVPEKSNLSIVQWAMFSQLWQILEPGCRVWLTPLPFDHSKLALVDGYWSLIGSANWDPRSLRLNFEFNVECYGRDVAARLEAIIDEKLSRARALTLVEVNRRSLPVKLRDGIARLFLPFL